MTPPRNLVHPKLTRLEPRETPSVVLVGEAQLSANTTQGQSRPAIAADAGGNVVAVWSAFHEEGGGKQVTAGVVARRFNSQMAPLGDEIFVNQYTTNDQSSPDVAVDAAGNFVVVWQSEGQDGAGAGVFGRRFDPAANPVANEFQINQYTFGDQDDPAVAMDADGDFVVTWVSDYQDGSFDAVVARRFNSAGVAQGNEFVVNQYATIHQRKPAVAMDSDGDFVIAWESSYFGQAMQDGSGSAIAARRYNRFGAAQGNEFVANELSTGSQLVPAVAMAAGGDFVIAWTETGSVEFRRFTANGAAETGDLLAATDIASPNHTALAFGTDGYITLGFDANGHYYVRVVDGDGVPVGDKVKVATKASQVSAPGDVVRVGEQVVALRGSNGINAGRFELRQPPEFVLFSGGFLWRRDGSAWSSLSSNVAKVSDPVRDWYGRSVIAVTFNNGFVYQYVSDGTWTSLGGGTMAVTPGRENTYVAFAAGGLWQYNRTNNTWGVIGGGFVDAVTVGYASAAGGEYLGVLFQGGNAWSRSFQSGWFPIAQGVKQIEAMPDAKFAVVFTNGGLWTRGILTSGTWSSLTANVASVAAGTGPMGNGSQLDVLYTGGSVWSYASETATWTSLTTNAHRLGAPADGRSYVLFVGGYLWTRDTEWNFVAGNVI